MPTLPLSTRLNMALRMAVGAFPVNPGSAGAMVLGGTTQAESPRMGSEQFLKAYSTMPWLRAATHRIAEATSSVRWHVMALQRNGRFRRSDFARESPAIRRKMLIEARQAGELIEIEDTPLLRVLHSGNNAMTGSSVRRVTQVYLDLLGEAFWLKERNRFGVPEQVWPLAPTWIASTPTPSHPVYEVNFRGWQGAIPDTEVLWFKDPDPVNPYGRGSGTALALADELETDEFAAKHVKNWFFNAAIPPIVVSPRQDSSHNTWSETQRRQLETSWNQRHQGFWKAFKTMFAPVPIEIQQLSHSFREQQLGELRRQERDIIIQVFGIPPESLGIIESSNRATIEASDLLLAKNVVVPRLELLRETIQERLVPEYDDRLIVDYDDPVPENDDFKLEAFKAQPQAPTQNEWRELQGLPPIPSGNVHHVPAAIVAQEAVLEAGQRGVGVAPVSTSESVEGATRTAPPRLVRAPLFVDNIPDDEFYLLVHRVADRLTPSLQRRFIEIINRARDTVDMGALESALRSQLAAAVEDVIPFGQIVESLREAASETFRQTVTDAGIGAAQEMSEQFGVGIGFNEASPNVAQFAQSQSALLVTRIDETSREAIRQAVSRAFQEGRTADQVAREIRNKIGLLPRQESTLEKFRLALTEAGRPEAEIVRRTERLSQSLLRQRSTLIARTEMIDAASEGQHQLWQQAANEGVMDRGRARRFWIVTPDDRLDTIVCEPIPFLNPNGVGLNEPFQIGGGGTRMRPTAHPGCVTGDSLIYAEGIHAATSRFYQGDLVIIRTASGKRLACTPNHPILTDRGWHGASSLNVGSYVISGEFSHGGSSFFDKQNKNVPSTMHEITESFFGSCKVSPIPVPVAAPDFHGDGGGSEIAVIGTDRLLWDWNDPSIREHGIESLFIFRHLALEFDRAGHLNALLESGHSPFRGSMGGADLLGSLVGGHLGPFEQFGLSAPSNMNSVFSQNSVESPSAGKEFARQLFQRFPGKVFADKIRSIDIVSFSGHVYNLHAEDEWYSANGIITHNCRCAVTLRIIEDGP